MNEASSHMSVLSQHTLNIALALCSFYLQLLKTCSVPDTEMGPGAINKNFKGHPSG